MLTIELPWPDPALAPNRVRGHWAKVSDKRAKAFEAAYVLTFQAVNQHKGPWADLSGEHVPLRITFNPPDKRKRDLDGALSSLKQSLDGVATALTLDDSRFNPITLKRGEVRKGGAVLVEVGT
jgi:crossover junction endodeoxyribonuclease RusA